MGPLFGQRKSLKVRPLGLALRNKPTLMANPRKTQKCPVIREPNGVCLVKTQHVNAAQVGPRYSQINSPPKKPPCGLPSQDPNPMMTVHKTSRWASANLLGSQPSYLPFLSPRNPGNPCKAQVGPL